MSEVPIIKVNYGIASRYYNAIEINEKLDKYPELKSKIIDHELRHNKGKYTKKDFINDFQSKQQTFTECMKFCMINKEALINYFPFMYSYHFKQWTFNISSIFPFINFGFIFVLFFHYILELTILSLTIGWIITILIINIICLIKTHSYVRISDKKQKLYIT